MKRIYTLALVATMFLPMKQHAQDALQFSSNHDLLQLNPSFAGSNGAFRDQVSYRSQGHNLTANFISMSNSFDFFIPKIGGGIGITAKNEDYARGTQKYSEVGIAYAQHLKFLNGDLTVSPSAQFCYSHRQVDLRNLYFGSLPGNFVVLPYGQLPQTNKRYLDINSGILMKYKKDLYAGVSVMHVTQPDAGLLGHDQLPARFNLHGAYTFHFSAANHLQIFYRYCRQQTFHNQLLAANFIFSHHVVTGVGVASSLRPFVNIGYRNNWMSAVLGYDALVSQLADNYSAYGAWQLNAAFSFGHKGDDKKAYRNFEAW